MAAAIVSQVQSQLVSFATEEVKKRGKLVIDAEKDVQKLISTFTAIEALLLDAEEKQLKNESIRDWLKKLKDVSCEIDDVLDEWRTEVLKRRLEGDDDAAGGCLELKLIQIADVLKRVCPFLPTYCFSIDEIGLRYDIGSRIKDLNERLEDIDKEKKWHNLTPKKTASYSSMPTSSVIDFSSMKVRLGEFKILQGKLLDDGNDQLGVRSISIQGLGGFGKTTLAKMLYNDKKVEDHFSKRVWVCVSANFVQETVAKAILESFNQSAPKDSSLSYMLEQIKSLMEVKKFLLVLDDVWEDSRSKWEELISSVSHGLPGSKILVTTRKEGVSHVFRCIKKDIFPLPNISDGECLTIFTQIAFYGWSDEERERVEDLCERVVEKCSGSPLAAKVLGGVLHVKKSKRDGIQLLGSEMWQIEKGRDEVLAPLALSYYDLPPTLRQCFQFCSVFPQDYEMEKEELIKLWISQGFLKATTNQDMEKVGEEYFQILVTRSLLQDVENEWQLGEERTLCKMHDLVHDFARLTTKNECISILKQDSSLLLIINEVRHLMVNDLSSEEINKLISSIISSRISSTKRNHYLRSFTVRNGSAIEPEVYAHLRGIRSLILNYCDLEEIPSTINQLIHLRHLDLSSNRHLMDLPEEICELYNLESLLLNHNENLRMFPSGMGNKLVNLKHLENYEVPAVLPKSMTRLGNSLKKLTTFNVVYDQEADTEGATNIGDLECMNQIQGSLTITRLSKVTNCEEVERAELAKKESLTRLSLEFDSSEYGDSDKEEQVLEAITPPSSLERLYIGEYRGGSIFPSWLLSLSNLTSLEFHGCHEVEHLPPFGALPSLEELRLGNMFYVNKVGLEFLLGTSVIQQLRMGNNEGDIIAFPKLTRLGFSRMENWEVWDLERDDQEGMISLKTVMPRLRSLELEWCEKLEKLPDVLLRKITLQELIINDSGGLGSYRFDPRDPKMMPNDVWDKISHIPTILLDYEDIRKTFESEIESMSRIGCSYSKPEEEEAGDDDDDHHDDEKRLM
ncbi:unnamed protein product [Linum tenue]|uniref:Uncharacterized protein n=1 Tax=Linum tenue TaxID=586396 RepID=A0AAV0M0W8_9ROSI|nr:unnamed protein product [Linum tenue]